MYLPDRTKVENRPSPAPGWLSHSVWAAGEEGVLFLEGWCWIVGDKWEERAFCAEAEPVSRSRAGRPVWASVWGVGGCLRAGRSRRARTCQGVWCCPQGTGKSMKEVFYLFVLFKLRNQRVCPEVNIHKYRRTQKGRRKCPLPCPSWAPLQARPPRLFLMAFLLRVTSLSVATPGLVLPSLNRICWLSTT